SSFFAGRPGPSTWGSRGRTGPRRTAPCSSTRSTAPATAMAGDGGCSGSTAYTRTPPRTSASCMAGRRSCGGSRHPKGADPMAARTPAFRKLTKLDLAFLLILLGVGGRLALLRVANVGTVLGASLLAGGFLGGAYALRPTAELL